MSQLLSPTGAGERLPRTPESCGHSRFRSNPASSRKNWRLSTGVTLRILVLCGNSLCLDDDLLFIFEPERSAAAIGAIEDQIVVASHDARKEKPMDAGSNRPIRFHLSLIENCARSQRVPEEWRDDGGPIR